MFERQRIDGTAWVLAHAAPEPLSFGATKDVQAVALDAARKVVHSKAGDPVKIRSLVVDDAARESAAGDANHRVGPQRDLIVRRALRLKRRATGPETNRRHGPLRAVI